MPRPFFNLAAARARALSLAAIALCLAAAGALIGWSLTASEASVPLRWGSSILAVGLLGVALLVQHLAVHLGQLQAHAARAASAAAQANAQLWATLDILPDGLAIYDADDRLVLYNTRYRDIQPGLQLQLQIGDTFEEVARRAAQAGVIVGTEDTREAQLAARMQAHRTARNEFLQELAGDQWARVTERALEGGGVIMLRSDVTDVVRKERALRQAIEDAEHAERNLREAIDAMPAGLDIYDAQDRLILCNQHMARMRPHLPLEQSIGKTYEELLREGLRHGIPAQAIGQEELWLAHELALRGHRTGPEVRHYPGGVWMHMHETRTPSGQTISVRLDITDLIEQRQQAEAARQESQHMRQLLERAVEALPVGIEIFDERDRLVLYNQHLARMYPHVNYPEHLGKTFADILRHSVRQGLIPSAQGREEAWIAERLSEHGNLTSNLLQRLSDDRWINIYETRTPENYVVSVRLDVTDLIEQRQALEAAQDQANQARRLLQDAVESLTEGFALFDADDRLVVFNTQYRKLYPLAAPMIALGHHFEDMLRYAVEHGQYPDALGQEEAWIAQRLLDHRAADRAVLQRLPEGRWVQVYEQRTPQGGTAGVRTDVTDLVRKEQELAAANSQLALLSTTDGVTGISNRRRFDERLATECKRCARQHKPLALILVDIDHFKHYNDHYGHVAGDECLRRVAQLLTASTRRADEIAARYGGEEFVLLLPDMPLPDALAVAQRCMQQLLALAIPHGASPTARHVTASMGVVSLVPRPEDSPDTLVLAADTALYRAKAAGRNRIEVFSPPAT